MTNALEKELTEILHKSRIPGCSVAVVDGSRLLWSHGFGFADLRSKKPAAPTTVYHLFSATKLYTAVAVLQLVEARQVALEGDVTEALPDTSPALRGITVQQLLTHTSGLKDTLRGLLAIYFPDEPPPSAADALAGYKLKRSRPPGKKVEYRNVNYAILGALVERVSGVPFRDYVRDRILTPLGIDAGFEVSTTMRENMATAYMSRWDPFRLLLPMFYPQAVRARLVRGRLGNRIELNDYNLSTAAIGGLVGTVEAFSRFLQFQLAGNSDILSAELIKKMQTPAARGKAGIESKEGMGLGWKLGRCGGVPFLNHEGGGAGFTTETRLYPDNDLGIVLAMNTMRMPNTMRVAHALCEVIRERRGNLGDSR